MDISRILEHQTSYVTHNAGVKEALEDLSTQVNHLRSQLPPQLSQKISEIDESVARTQEQHSQISELLVTMSKASWLDEAFTSSSNLQTKFSDIQVVSYICLPSAFCWSFLEALRDVSSKPDSSESSQVIERLASIEAQLSETQAVGISRYPRLEYLFLLHGW